MPYLIEKSDGSSVAVEMTADEAAFKAQTFCVLEVALDGSVVGVVGTSAEDVMEVAEVVEVQSEQPVQDTASEEDVPAPAAKPARKSRKA